MKPPKDQTIETLRGLAIIFMLAGHVIGTPGMGMKVNDDSLWRYFYFSFEYIRMPLFTVISGYVYSLRPAINVRFDRFLIGKMRRILLPLFFVGTLFFLTQYFIPGTNTKPLLSDIWKIYLFSYAHFWFLQAIFLIFLVVGLLDHFNILNSFRIWLMVFITTAAIRQIQIPTDFFSLQGFTNLLPFFILGCGLRRYEMIFRNEILIKILSVALFILLIIQQYTWYARINLDFFNMRILSFFLASTAIIVLFYVRKDIPIFSKVGYYAYGIYLFHVFGTAGSRIFLMRIGINNEMAIFLFGMIFGVAIPILIEIIFERSKILRRLFFGLR